MVKRTYGSTEAPTVTTSFAGDDPDRARSTDGRPTGKVRLRIAHNGEIEVRGPELFVGYTDPDRTRDAVADGWFRTGDLGTVDDEGWLTVTGRLKDLIIRGGENIAAAEVERVLEAHPGVRQAAAVGQPDRRLGERVCAFVVCAPGAQLDLATCGAWFAEQGRGPLQDARGGGRGGRAAVAGRRQDRPGRAHPPSRRSERNGADPQT